MISFGMQIINFFINLKGTRRFHPIYIFYKKIEKKCPRQMIFPLKSSVISYSLTLFHDLSTMYKKIEKFPQCTLDISLTRIFFSKYSHNIYTKIYKIVILASVIFLRFKIFPLLFYFFAHSYRILYDMTWV